MNVRLALVVVLLAAATSAVGASFTAQETHQGFTFDQADGTKAKLVTNGWFPKADDPALVYRSGGKVIAGVWRSGPDGAVVRAGTTKSAAMIGRVVPSWTDGALTLSIEPA